MDLDFHSRRSDVLGKRGCVSCNQPLAAKIGLSILEQGGNAADAAVATAAALAVLEPTSTGLGGDVFALYYDAESKVVSGMNGSGHSPDALTLEVVRSHGFKTENPIPPNHGLSTTVPGAPAAWIDTLEQFGSQKVTRAQVLSPAIRLAEEGFPVTEIVGYWWKKSEQLLKSSRFGNELLLFEKAPRVGEIMRVPAVANTLKELVKHGKKGYYEGRVAQMIVDEVVNAGGVMTLKDLAKHTSTLVQPISVTYKGVNLWEIPPNGLGITALMAANILEGYNLRELGLNSPEYLHLLTEAFKLSFADTLTHVADPEKEAVPVEQMLSKDYAAQRRSLISPEKALEVYLPGDLPKGSDTTYFSVVDQWGNACSYINSNYQGFGTGLVPAQCGFSLQNRGLCFSLDKKSANVVAPNKRPMHTIIPAMITSATDNSLLACYGIMAGFMQPQAHVQVLLNMLEFGLSPQRALDQPRLFVDIPGVDLWPSVGKIKLEQGMPQGSAAALRALGHSVEESITGHGRAIFGRGHVISKGAWWARTTDSVANDHDVLWAGADPRSDGCSLAF